MLERAGAQVESEIHQSVKLLLRQRHRNQIVHGLHGPLGIFLQPGICLFLRASHTHGYAVSMSVSDGGNAYAIQVSFQAATFK